jgi:hypothetical protein
MELDKTNLMKEQQVYFQGKILSSRNQRGDHPYTRMTEYSCDVV